MRFWEIEYKTENEAFEKAKELSKKDELAKVIRKNEDGKFRITPQGIGWRWAGETYAVV
jgi:hypothetical protein